MNTDQDTDRLCGDGEAAIIEARTATIRIIQDGIVRITIKQSSHIVLDDAKEIFSGLKDLLGDSRAPVLADIRGIRSANREARQYPSLIENTVGLALLVKSSTSTIIGNFFLGLNKPPYPTKLFTSEAKALDWLRGLQR